MKSIKYVFLALAVMLASLAWAPMSAPSRPGLKSPISSRILTLDGIDATVDGVTLKWSKATPTNTAALTDYEWEISEYNLVDTTSVASTHTDYGKFKFPLLDGTAAPSVVGDPLHPTESVDVPAATFEYNKTYYWHVRSNDDYGTGTWSSWSTVGSFRVGTQAPDPAPASLVVEYPALPSALLTVGAKTLRPTFKWAPDTDTVATSYTFELSLYPDFSTKVVTTTILSTAPLQYTPTANLIANDDYYWRVRANNTTKGASLWTTYVDALGDPQPVTAAPPTIPVLSAPITGSLQITQTPTFRWKPSSSQGSSLVNYILQVYSDNPDTDTTPTLVNEWDTADGVPTAPNTMSGTTPLIEYTIPDALDHAKTYYWRVIAEANNNDYSMSSVNNFKVGTQAPAATSLEVVYPTPLPSVIITANAKTLRPTFKWGPDAATIATSYTFELSLYSNFSTKVVTATILATSPLQYMPTADLVANTNYYWRVRANNSTYGASGWATYIMDPLVCNPVAPTVACDPRPVFATPPTRPVLVAPVNANLQMDLTPTFQWKPSTDQGGGVPQNYILQIFSTNPATTDTPTLVGEWDNADGVPDTANAGTSTAPLIEFELPAVDELSSALTYYWRVLAVAANDDYSFSTTTLNFRTGIVGAVDGATMDPGPTFGNVPGLEGPAGGPSKSILFNTVEYATGDNINLLTLRPTFKWDPGLLNVQSFVLQVASVESGSCNPTDFSKSTFATKILNVSVPASKDEYTPTTNLPANQILCWRLQPYHSVYAPTGKGLWSDVQIFLTANPPSAPTLLSPLDGTLTNDSSPMFDWTDSLVPSGEPFGKYELEISRFSSFSGYIYDNNVAPYQDPAGIVYPLPSDPALPMIPNDTALEPILPMADGFTSKSAIPLYDTLFGLYPQIIHPHGTNDGDAENFEDVHDYKESYFQMHEEFDTAAPPAFGPLYGAATYWWRVRAINANGEYSNWSAPFSVNISPDRPQNVTVMDSTPATLRPLVEWDPIINAYTGYDNNGYKIVFFKTMGTDTSADDRSVFASFGYTYANEYIPTSDLPADTELYAKVYAYNAYGMSLFGASDKFTTSVPPLAPSGLLSPATASLVLTNAANEYEPTLKWKLPSYDMTPKGQTFDDYEIQISDDPTFPVTSTILPVGAAGELTTSYTIDPATTPLDPMRRYYWRVRTCSTAPDTCSAWTPAFSFKTAIYAPENLSSGGGADPLKPLLEWDAVYGAKQYRVYLTRGTTTTCGGTGVVTTSNSYQVTYNLLPATDYAWCVVAYDYFGFGPSIKSAVDTFTTP